MIKKIAFIFVSFFIYLFVLAQDSAVVVKDRQATGLRAEGKIYVVLAVSLTILVGLFIYLIRIDKKNYKAGKSQLKFVLTNIQTIKKPKWHQIRNTVSLEQS